MRAATQLHQKVWKKEKDKEIRYLIVLRFFLSQSFSRLGMR